MAYRVFRNLETKVELSFDFEEHSAGDQQNPRIKVVKISYSKKDTNFTGEIKFNTGLENASSQISLIEAYPHRQRLGAVLMYLAAEYIASKKISKVILTLVNPLAYTFYSRMGFWYTNEHFNQTVEAYEDNKSLIPLPRVPADALSANELDKMIHIFQTNRQYFRIPRSVPANDVWKMLLRLRYEIDIYLPRTIIVEGVVDWLRLLRDGSPDLSKNIDYYERIVRILKAEPEKLLEFERLSGNQLRRLLDGLRDKPEYIPTDYIPAAGWWKARSLDIRERAKKEWQKQWKDVTNR